ncbi:hypothetical protein N7462_007085 [Penicillium macrosclerotiorum]|uniref:uncharacterized protein n=1 Tax=Penicillium macrosclerotiorum TaxID=303699 RepID=UPI0025498564|nr:uncharacterized protein N7462_007085 [Penicillium macrosclerotiorum]KAJ5678841.1 hypothetical protein N7462_007085 [Penicillium macrosclerotiorum]
MDAKALAVGPRKRVEECTKMLTALACMQLVEQGCLELDNGLFLESLYLWAIDEFSGRFEDIQTPLLFQPGEGWEYGVSLDWAGLAVERVTGFKLNEYLKQLIFDPLGLENMSMVPDAEMRGELAHMHSREIDGKLKPRDHLLRAPLVLDPNDEDEAGKLFNSGGAGMFAKPQEYCRILAVLLNDGTCPRTGAQILREETVQEMFRNQNTSVSRLWAPEHAGF